jgi:hypothetical protein
MDNTNLCLSNKELTELPDLSNYHNLKYLDCYNNQLISLEHLPISLQILNCLYNNLITLDNLPIHLIKLNCRNNQLLSLDHLPNGLKVLIC